MYLRARTVEEAVALIGKGAAPLAGGTLLSQEVSREGRCGALVDVAGIDGLDAIQNDSGSLLIGALVTIARLEASGELAREHQALRSAARSIGNPHVRRAGTVGGNVALGLPGASLPPALLVLDAEVLLQGPEGAFSRGVAEVTSRGVPPSSLITAVRLPRGNDRRSTYVKFGGRHQSARAMASVAVSLRIDGGLVVDPRLSAAGLCRAVRLPGAERILAGQPLSPTSIGEAAWAGAAEVPFEEPEVWPGEAHRRRLVSAGIRQVLTEIAAS